jgi:hypothetical protein
MAQQDEQMRVGAREGFKYHPVTLVLLANGKKHEVDSTTFFKRLSIHLKYCPAPTLN